MICREEDRNSYPFLNYIEGEVMTDYKLLYEQLLSQEQIPGVSYLNITNSTYEIRDLFVDLGEVYADIEGKGLNPRKISIYADVVRIPASFSRTITDAELILRSRRVEVESAREANLRLNYENGKRLARITIYALELSGNITITPVFDEGEGTPLHVEIANKGVRILNKDGELTAEEITYVVSTSLFENLFTSVFQAGTLFFESHPTVAIDQLRWLKVFTADFKNLSSLCLQSATLLTILTANFGENTFVPVLDKELYRAEMTAYLAAAEKVEEQYFRYLDQNLSIEDRKAAALLMLKHEEDTLLFKETLINQTKDNVENARDAINASILQFTKQQHAVTIAKIDFEYGLKKYEYEQQLKLAFKMVMTVLNFAESIGTMVATGGTSAPGEMLEIIGGLKEIIEAGGALGALAEQMKENLEKLNELVELVNQISALAKELADAANDAELSDELLEKLKEREWKVPQEDLTGAATWKIFELKSAAALQDAIDKSIEGANKYLLELNILSVYGQTIASSQVALIRCSQQLAQQLLEKYVNEANLNRLKEYINGLDDQSGENTEMEQKLYQRYLTMKEIIFVALQNYKHAYKYWALRDSDVRPNILKDISELKVDVALLQQDCMRALLQFSPPPQPFQKRVIEITDPQIIQSLSQTREASWQILLEDEMFDKEYRVRLKIMRIWLEGVNENEKVRVKITNSGHYFDHFRQQSFQFNTEPFKLSFSYKGQEIDVDGKIAEEFAYDYFIPNPFTTWNINVVDGPDLSTVTKIRMEFAGSLVADYKQL